MQKKLKNFTKNLNRLIFIFLCSLTVTDFLYAAHGVMPIDDTEVELPDGRWVLVVRNGELSHCLVIKAKGKVQTLSKQCYEQEFDRLWQYAFFVPVKNGHYVYDIDGDGNIEIGIATWDGGNNIADRDALVFSVKGNKLTYFSKRRFNLEYGQYLYK